MLRSGLIGLNKLFVINIKKVCVTIISPMFMILVHVPSLVEHR